MRDRVPSRPMHRTIATFLRTATIPSLTLVAIFFLLTSVALCRPLGVFLFVFYLCEFHYGL
jgi:hypothetical protein